MTKKQVIKGCYALISREAEARKLTIKDNGTGHGFDNTVWPFLDLSNIPNVVAENDDYKIELRSFWGDPEIDISIKTPIGQELLIFNFSDSVKKGDKYEETGDFHVHQLRVDGLRGNYKKAVEQVYEMIDFVMEMGSNEF